MTPTLPASWYRDPARYEAERAAIFGDTWLPLAHASELDGPGATLARTVAGWPLLLVRGEDGVVRGFHNACRHRAGPLLHDGEQDRCKALRCRYHGWTYGLDGALRATPLFGADPPEGVALHPLAVACWRGLVFVHLGAAPPPLEAWLAPFAAVAGEVPLDGWRPHSRARHTLACNWKVYVENYMEGYHIPFVHPALNREVDMGSYVVEAGQRFAVHRVATREGAVSQGLWAWLWPLTALNLYGDGMNLERIVPDGPRRTHVEYLYLFRGDAPTDEADRQRAIAMSREVTLEDVRICEAVQRNLDAGAYDTGWLSPRHEGGVAAFQALVRAALGGDNPGRP